MENVEARGPTAAMILGIVGGFALAIGSFLTWATVSVDFDRIASGLGIDPDQIPAEVRAQGMASVTGWKADDGKWTLVAGIVVVVAATLLAMASSRRIVGIVMVVGGAVGGGLALYDATIEKDDVIDNVAAAFSGIGLPGVLRDYFTLSLGIGIWLCIVGGVVAIAAGVLAMTGQGAGLPETVHTSIGFTPPPPADAGFGIAEVGGSLVPPVAPVPVAEVMPEPEPAASPGEPGEGSGTGVPPAGDDPPGSP